MTRLRAIKRFFYDNKEVFERIVDLISNDDKLNTRIGKWINPEELNQLTTKQLRRLKIEVTTQQIFH